MEWITIRFPCAPSPLNAQSSKKFSLLSCLGDKGGVVYNRAEIAELRICGNDNADFRIVPGNLVILLFREVGEQNDMVALLC